LSCDRAANEEDIGVPRGPHEFDPKTLGVIIRSKNIDDFDITSVARSAVSVVHPKRFAKRLTAKTF
jgi:hypothetical protein